MRVSPIVASLLGLFAACAGYAPPKEVQAGASEAQVVQAMGEPTGRYPLPQGGRRLEFARGPNGRHTYMVDLDAQGRVVEWDQVLQPRYFELINPGMKSDEVLKLIGRPSERQGASRGSQIWSWRYANNDCLWWQAQVDAQGVVTGAGYASERGCALGM